MERLKRKEVEKKERKKNDDCRGLEAGIQGKGSYCSMNRASVLQDEKISGHAK